MSVTHGMNVEEVEALGRLLQRKADLLREIAASINSTVYRGGWGGDDGAQFRDMHWPRHRARLYSSADRLQGFGQSALNNASEQRQASNAGSLPSWGQGVPGFAGTPSGSWDPHAVMGGTGMFGGLFSVLGDTKHLPWAQHLGKGIGWAGYGASGVQIYEHAANGRYGDAAFEGAFLGGDIAADGLKASKTPHGYGIGVAVQTWTEVGREARNVDWSAEGMQQVRDASLGDWGAAFGEACTQMPGKLVKIFGF